MTYLQPSNRRGKSSKTIWVAYGTLLCVALLGFVLNKLAFMVGGPLWSVRASVVQNIDTIGSYFSSKSSLEKQASDLQKELDAKDAEILLTKNQLDLYKGLDDYISKKEIQKDERVVRVVTRPPQTPFDVVVVEAQDDFVQSGTNVYFAGVLVGKVDSRVGSYARVSLLSHPASQFRVLVGSKKNEGEAKGKSQGNISVTLPKSVDVKEGDVVYMAEGTIPFGTVSKVDESSSQSFVDVYIKLPFSPLLVDWLTVRKD